jgi:hypothetical protein
MLSAPLRYLSIIASLVVLASIGAFGIDQARSGSEASRAGITSTGYRATADPSGYARPSPAQERVREQAHGDARELLDDADDLAVAPFAAVVSSSASAWVRRGIPALIALFVYGFGLGYLARFAAGRA